MSNSENHNFSDINNNGLSEKIRKYGDPKRNLIITAITILVITFLVGIFFWKNGQSGITGVYADYYPASTSIYVDAKLDAKNIDKINELTKLNIRDLPDLLSRLFLTNYTKERININKLMSEAFDDSFSFGVWNDNRKERSLAVFTVKREAKIRPLFESIFNKKLADKNFKGYKATISPDTGVAFSMIRDKLYVADSYDTLAFIIKNHILKSEKSLYDRSNVKHSVNLLEGERIGTIIVADYTSGISRLSGMIGGKYKGELADIEHFLKSVDVTAISVLLDKNLVYFNSYTSYNLSQIKSQSLKKAYENIFSKKHIDFNPGFLPENTLSFLLINELKDYIDFTVELSGIKATPEYDQFKQFIKLLTSLDFDKDILEILKNDTTIAAIDVGNGKTEYVAVLANDNNTAHVISKLMKLIPLQLPSAEMSTITYKKLDLGLISDKKHSLMINYGKITPDLYAIGEKLAVESLIDATDKNKLNITEKDIYKRLNVQNLNDFRFLAYVNIQGLKKIEAEKAGIKNKVFLDKIKNNIKAALFTIKAENNVIKGSLQINLK